MTIRTMYIISFIGNILLIICTILSAILAAGCAVTHVDLTPSAEALTLKAQADDCDVVRQVNTRVGPNWHGWEHNVDLAERLLRNEAAEAGSTAIILHPPQSFDPGVSTTGCPGCVAMSATALRCAP